MEAPVRSQANQKARCPGAWASKVASGQRGDTHWRRLEHGRGPPPVGPSPPQRDHLVRPAQERLSAPQIRIPGSDLSYGYGWWISDTPFGRLAYHDGHYAGFESALLRYLDFDATIIVLANTRLMTEPRTWISAIRRETEQSFRVRQTVEWSHQRE